MPSREKIVENLTNFVSKHNLTEYSSLVHITAYHKETDGEQLKLAPQGCHYYFGNHLQLDNYKDKAFVTGLFQRILAEKQRNPATNYYGKNTVANAEMGLFGPDSMYKDIHHLLTYIKFDDPSKNLVVYMNDTGKDLTPYERALVFNFFTHTRFYSERSHALPNFDKLISKGFSYQEAVIFSQEAYLDKNQIINFPLPRYGTHGPFNGPSIQRCFRFLFGLGPNKKGDFPLTGLVVDDALWSNMEAPSIFFDGSGESKGVAEQGFFGKYSLGRGNLKYTSIEDSGVFESLRSFIDNYKKEYVK